MNKEREELLTQILEKAGEEKKIEVPFGNSRDPHFQETTALYAQYEQIDSDLIEDLEAAGFKSIFPAKLPDEAIERMDKLSRDRYERKMRHSMIVDTQEPHRTVDLVHTIAKHYYSTGDVEPLSGIDKRDNSITEFPWGNFREGSSEEFSQILRDIGYQTEIGENGQVKAFSDVPYPVVKKSKFGQIYDKAKGRIKDVFSKIKSMVSSKEETKENNSNEEHE